jgi:hypothetical protein
MSEGRAVSMAGTGWLCAVAWAGSCDDQTGRRGGCCNVSDRLCMYFFGGRCGGSCNANKASAGRGALDLGSGRCQKVYVCAREI